MEPSEDQEPAGLKASCRNRLSGRTRESALVPGQLLYFVFSLLQVLSNMYVANQWLLLHHCKLIELFISKLRANSITYKMYVDCTDLESRPPATTLD